MNEQKYSKVKAFGLMVKRGTTGFLKSFVEPYYSFHRGKELYGWDIDSDTLRKGPLVRNMTIYAAAEAIKTLAGQPFTNLDIALGLIPVNEGFFEGEFSDNIYASIKNSWNKAKDVTIKVRVKIT